jgi:hypothetical protein
MAGLPVTITILKLGPQSHTNGKETLNLVSLLKSDLVTNVTLSYQDRKKPSSKGNVGPQPLQKRDRIPVCRTASSRSVSVAWFLPSV